MFVYVCTTTTSQVAYARAVISDICVKHLFWFSFYRFLLLVTFLTLKKKIRTKDSKMKDFFTKVLLYVRRKLIMQKVVLACHHCNSSSSIPLKLCFAGRSKDRPELEPRARISRTVRRKIRPIIHKSCCPSVNVLSASALKHSSEYAIFKCWNSTHQKHLQSQLWKWVFLLTFL